MAGMCVTTGIHKFMLSEQMYTTCVYLKAQNDKDYLHLLIFGVISF